MVTLDFDDTYLNLAEKSPAVIEVDAKLQRNGQRIATGAWFKYVDEIFEGLGRYELAKEPTLFTCTRTTKPPLSSMLMMV